ncbi:MAG TPA: hypothetical protein VMT21_06840 [Gemmatimonadales bacterium]|nr:hypothetical protein [Gemmatimonadales bacterium]
MARRILLLVIVAAAGAAPVAAQKPPPVMHPQTQPQAQAPASSKSAGKVFRPAARAAAPATQPAPTPAQTAAPAAQPAAQPAAPVAQPAGLVTPQSARLPATASAFTAGLAMPAYGGGTSDAALDYAARFGRLLDSAIVTLVDIFRNTSGQPMEGASNPTDLSQRERDRWARCRNVYWDLTTFAAAVETLRRTLPANPALQHAVAGLDSAFAASQAVVECDNVASMIAAPDRWTPWGDQYRTAAQHFYRDFYGQVRDVHERDRALVNTLNTVLPAARRIPVPPALQRNAPYAGMAPGN